MIILETKLKGTIEQYGRLDEAIRTAQFVRNSSIRYWMDNKGVEKGDLSRVMRDFSQRVWVGRKA